MSEESRKRLRKALDSLVYLPTPDSTEVPSKPAPAAKGQTWDRKDLFTRLQTFRSATWFAKPAGITPADCARHGWENTGVDTLACEFCGARLVCPIPDGAEAEDVAALASRYSEQLVSKHAASCPWRSAACPVSLLRFPPLPQATLAEDLAQRTASLQRLVCLPPIAAGQLEAIAGVPRAGDLLARLCGAQGEARPGAPALTALLAGGGTAARGSPAFEARARLLALLGWSLRDLDGAARGGGGGAAGAGPPATPGSAVLTCALCGASVGMWSSFPSAPPAFAARSPPGSAAAGMGRARTGVSPASIPGTTIAGGAAGSTPGLPEAPAPDGPFGRPGPPSTPAFGLATLATCAEESAERAARCQGVLGAKRAAAEATQGAADAQAAAGPVQYLSSAALQRYAALESAAMEPLDMHRSFCPWLPGPGGEHPGWRWVWGQLCEDGQEMGASLDGGPKRGEELAEESKTKAWDPSALLRTVLDKVSVRL
ncbi:hypothetical protein ACKKBG_A36570 [Auxenochlorella protothecoides x Auxenochlorella symbiontica]